MSINLLSIPVIVMASLCIYVALNHFWFYVHKKPDIEHLSFALTCITIGLYDFFCVGLYNSQSIQQGMLWQRFQFASLALFSIVFMWFVVHLLKNEYRKFFYVTSGLFVLFLIIGLSFPNSILFDLSHPIVKEHLLFQSVNITYYEATPGLVYNLQYGLMVIVFIYFLFRLFFYSKKHSDINTKTLFISIIIFFIISVNDILVGMGLYSFIYLIEYTFMIIIFSMTFALFNKFVILYEQITVLNQNLERTVKKRTARLKKAYRQIKKLAYIDPLTKTYNRRGMYHSIEREISILQRELFREKRNSNYTSFVLMIMDVDDFKNINDTYGHDCGDFVLKKLSLMMKNLIRKQDVLARWGGEEFLLLLPKTDLNGAKVLANKILKNVADTIFDYQDLEIKMTLTIGFSIYEEANQDIDKVLQKADAALYEGKHSGKNQIHFKL